MLDALKRLLQDPPPAMAFEISEAGIAAADGSIRAAGEHLGTSQGFYGSVLSRIQDAVNFGQRAIVILQIIQHLGVPKPKPFQVGNQIGVRSSEVAA